MTRNVTKELTKSMTSVVLRVAALSVLTVALLAGCRDGSDPTVDDPPNSGVRGVVTAGPRCPVVVQGSPCPDQPWQGAVRIATSAGEVVSTVETDDRGRFEAPLSEGRYEVIAETEQDRLPTASPQTVTVPQGEWVEVTLTVDTGIR